jgi:hypothetical protein
LPRDLSKSPIIAKFDRGGKEGGGERERKGERERD